MTAEMDEPPATPLKPKPWTVLTPAEATARRWTIGICVVLVLLGIGIAESNGPAKPLDEPLDSVTQQDTTPEREIVCANWQLQIAIRFEAGDVSGATFLSDAQPSYCPR